MKYLGSYNTYTDYKADLDAGNIKVPNVSLVGGKCYYKPIVKSNIGDLALKNTKTNSYEFCSVGAYKSSLYKLPNLTVIGIVAVPAMYTPDNTTRVMSMINMSCGDPDNGSGASAGDTTTISMKWGANDSGSGTQAIANGTKIDLPYYDKVVVVDPSTGEAKMDGTSVKTNNWVRIPSTVKDSWNGFVGYKGQYPGTYYYYGSEYYNKESTATGYEDNSNRFGPFPLLKDGTKNPLYFMEGMATNDFDGRGNTNAILTAASNAGVSWESGTIDASKTTTGYFPAAFCCDRYKPEGTSAGDWYLPAQGELSFVTAFYNELYTSSKEMEDWFGTTKAVRLGHTSSTYGSWLWSSSLHDSSNARSVVLDIGGVYGSTRSRVLTSNRVRAFLAL